MNGWRKALQNGIIVCTYGVYKKNRHQVYRPYLDETTEKYHRLPLACVCNPPVYRPRLCVRFTSSLKLLQTFHIFLNFSICLPAQDTFFSVMDLQTKSTHSRVMFCATTRATILLTLLRGRFSSHSRNREGNSSRNSRKSIYLR